MKQCPNCRCQVDVQAASCPYCGITLPMYRKAQPFGDTRLKRVDTAVSSGTPRKSGTNQTGTVRNTSVGGSTAPRQGSKPRTTRNDRYLHRDHQLIILLLTANLVIGLAQLLVQLFTL